MLNKYHMVYKISVVVYTQAKVECRLNIMGTETMIH